MSEKNRFQKTYIIKWDAVWTQTSKSNGTLLRHTHMRTYVHRFVSCVPLVLTAEEEHMGDLLKVMSLVKSHNTHKRQVTCHHP